MHFAVAFVAFWFTIFLKKKIVFLPLTKELLAVDCRPQDTLEWYCGPFSLSEMYPHL